ncbi:PaeR7I family type II restriction endonuclease [Salisaeta longa]|uniref:PaeR7I family type II restriction endonuclease n=1 Tax=Salisaeta longa TaxID=503170 RepID=UPI0003B561E6|nr:PaeR7I family type II restriction endonuclease [Salisaeta longa]
MALDLANYEARAEEAVRLFWETRGKARAAQEERRTVSDRGNRAAVTAGKNMDGFIGLIKQIVIANGLGPGAIYSGAETETAHRHVTLPGFYRPVKDWDFLVIHKNQLVAALEFKSQIGPSFGNNFNNRCEEAIGMASDLWVAYREGTFGDIPRPFLGYIMLLEDDEGSRRPVSIRSEHFDTLEVFENASYAKRYDVMLRHLMQERLYDAGTLLLSSKEEGPSGIYTELGPPTGLKRLVSGLAGHVATSSVT